MSATPEDASAAHSDLDQLVQAKPQRGGLANRLFPWARAVIHSTLAELPMVTTRWLQVKVGPMLRGESDRRIYSGLFYPEPWGVDRRFLDRVGPRTAIAEPVVLGLGTSHVRGRTLVCFTGLADYFERVVEHRTLVRDRLVAISKVGAVRAEQPAVIAHVRRGDFPMRLRTGDEWFLSTARFIRSCGYEGEFGLVSDGTESDLRPLLDAGFVPLCGHNALEDLWSLAGASVILASGASTFSTWATFLGEGVTLAPDHLDCTGLDRLMDDRVRRIGRGGQSDQTARLLVARHLEAR